MYTVLAVSLLVRCEVSPACNVLASALLCSPSPSCFQRLPRTASESCSEAAVSLCSLKRLPLLTPPDKTHGSATLNFKPCFYCLSKHCDACSLTTKHSILQPTPCCSQCEQLGHLCPAKPLRHVHSSDRQAEGKPVGAERLSEKEYSFRVCWDASVPCSSAIYPGRCSQDGSWQCMLPNTGTGRDPSAQKRS